MFSLDFSGYVSEVARGHGIYVGGAVGFITFLSSSPLPSSSLIPFAGGSSEGGPSATSLSVLSFSDGRHACCHTFCISFQLSTPPLAQFDGLHVASGHRVEPRWSIARRGMCGDNSARARGDFQRVLTRNNIHVIVGCWSRGGYIQRRSNLVTERDTSSSDIFIREISNLRLRVFPTCAVCNDFGARRVSVAELASCWLQSSFYLLMRSWASCCAPVCRANHFYRAANDQKGCTIPGIDAMDLAYMCVKPQMRLYVCQALPLPNTKCVYMCVTKCVYMCVTKCVYVCVTKCVCNATELASLARFLTF